eukprot:COSAG02_NODE_5538_length_4245_cov_120.115533_1_plen_42_part_00
MLQSAESDTELFEVWILGRCRTDMDDVGMGSHKRTESEMVL